MVSIIVIFIKMVPGKERINLRLDFSIKNNTDHQYKLNG